MSNGNNGQRRRMADQQIEDVKKSLDDHREEVSKRFDAFERVQQDVVSGMSETKTNQAVLLDRSERMEKWLSDQAPRIERHEVEIDRIKQVDQDQWEQISTSKELARNAEIVCMGVEAKIEGMSQTVEVMASHMAKSSTRWWQSFHVTGRHIIIIVALLVAGVIGVTMVGGVIKWGEVEIGESIE